MRHASGVVGLQPGEGRPIALVAGTFALVELARGLGEVGVDALVVGQYGSSALPPLYVALGLVGMILALGYSGVVGRASGSRFFPALLLGMGLSLVAAWAIASIGGRLAASLAWVAVYAVAGLALTALWTIAGRAFHARQAKRLFPLCASAAIAGSFLGQLAAGPLAGAVGAAPLVAMEGALLAAAAATASRLGSLVAAPPGSPLTAAAALHEGIVSVARMPLLRLIAVAYVLFAVLLVGVSYTFYGAMAEAYPDEAALASALGLFSATVTATAFVVSTLVANRLAARFGISALALLLPTVYLAGFVLWLLRFGLGAVVGVRFAQVVTQRGVSNAAWSAFFSVVPPARRGQVLAVMDGIPGQAGTIISGLLLLVIGTIGRQDLFAGCLVLAVILVVAVVAIRRAYVATLVATLRDGMAVRVLDGGPELATLVADPGVVQALAGEAAAARTSGPGGRADPRRCRAVAGLLAASGAPGAAAPLTALAGDADAAIRAEGLDGLATLAAGGVVGEGCAALASGAFRDPDPHVRRAAVRLFSAVGGPGGSAGPGPQAHLRALADDPDPGVRAELAVALAATDGAALGRHLTAALLASADPVERGLGVEAIGRSPGLVDEARTQLVDLVADPSPVVGRAAAAILARDGVGQARLVTVVVDGDQASLHVALLALEGAGGLDAGVRERLITWGEGEVDRGSRLRTASTDLAAALADPRTADTGARDRVPHPDPRPAAELLLGVLRVRIIDARRHLLAVLGALGPPGVAETVRRSLWARDRATRAAALEALEAGIGGRLARRVAAFLEDSAPSAAVRASTLALAVAPLAGDRDPWVRLLAVRTLGAVRDDGDAETVPDRVRGAPGGTGEATDRDLGGWRVDAMADGMAPSSELVERMLLLGRVPLFGALAPEDLARIAATAADAVYAPGDVLIREGDASDHLVVVAAGTARVVSHATGEERILRRCSVGEHVGELAMLREAPRAASVIAEDPGVRALLVDSDALRSVLRERPEAAIAMLRTLAERISRQ